jgi:diguanylate cyclase (GGDEF)-like protein/PAS domain S-box-containing protein
MLFYDDIVTCYTKVKPTIREKMKLKHIISKDIKIAHNDDTIYSLVETMKLYNISSIVIIDDMNHPVGLVTETDIVKIVATHQEIKNLKIKDLITAKKLFTQNKNVDIYNAFEIMQNNGHRHIVVTDEENKICGVATQSDFLKYLDSDLLTKMKVIKDVMIQNIITIKKYDTLEDAATLMVENKISSLVVLDGNNIPIGMVTERDMVKFASESMQEILIEKVIGKVLHTLTPDDFLYDALLIMKEFKIRRVVIVEDKTLVGLITRNDILKAIRLKKIEILSSNLHQKNLELEIIKKQDEELKLLGIALKSSPDGIIITDTDAKIKWCNQAFEELTGYSRFEILGKRPKELLYSGVQTTEFYKALWETILAKQSFKGEIKNKRKDGTIYDEKLTITPLMDGNGDISHFVAIKEDVTERNEMIYKINQIAHFDTLSGLPNKFSLMNEINQAILRANRNKSNVALLIVGLDNFKDINESFGHGVGDELLVLISKFIKHYVRMSDFVARITGDEFAILVENSDALDDIALMAEKFIYAMGRTWELANGASVYLGCTIGISTYPSISKNANELFQDSDAALFLAKRETKGSYRFYNNIITQKARTNIETISNLKSSIAKNEFIVVYQPQLDINTNKIIGAEALVRWVFNGEIISPLDFIPLAEERGLISGITDFVLQTTCADLKEFVEVTKEDIFKVSINVSSIELSNATVEKIRASINKYNVNKHNFGIEITESIFINDIKNAIRVLNRFKDDELLISMDDFGTGYSSLNYLKQLPIDILKIDKSFVDGLPSDKNDLQITKAIISMAKTLGIKTLAEGVETIEQLEFLKDEGCDFYQGYYFSKPIVKDEFLNILKKQY